MAISEPTAVFSIHDDKDQEIKQVMMLVYSALEEKGYNPVNQLVGYILSEDPTYITTYKNARALIRRIDRDDLLQALVRDYVKRRETGGGLDPDEAYLCVKTGAEIALEMF